MDGHTKENSGLFRVNANSGSVKKNPSNALAAIPHR
jgi:hypothetical protein